MRLRDYSDQIPKPLVEVGQRPILWHLMKYYAHYGHNEFILCLGHGAQQDQGVLPQLRRVGDATTSSSRDGGQQPRAAEHRHRRLEDHVRRHRPHVAMIGERLRRVQRTIGDDEMFLANYADGLSDLPLDRYVDSFLDRDKTASFLTVPAPHTFHIVHTDDGRPRHGLEPVGTSPVRINAGFFVLRREIFDYMRPGRGARPRTVPTADRRAAAARLPYDGFWRAWTRSRTRSNSTRSSPTATRRGRSGRE